MDAVVVSLDNYKERRKELALKSYKPSPIRNIDPRHAPMLKNGEAESGPEQELETAASELTQLFMVGLFGKGFGSNAAMERDLIMVKEAVRSLLNRRFGREHFLQDIIDGMVDNDPDPVAA